MIVLSVGLQVMDHRINQSKTNSLPFSFIVWFSEDQQARLVSHLACFWLSALKLWDKTFFTPSIHSFLLILIRVAGSYPIYHRVHNGQSAVGIETSIHTYGQFSMTNYCNLTNCMCLDCGRKQEYSRNKGWRGVPF